MILRTLDKTNIYTTAHQHSKKKKRFFKVFSEPILIQMSDEIKRFNVESVVRIGI